MTVVAFDPHAAVKQLLAAGFTDAEAAKITLAARKAHCLKWIVTGLIVLRTIVITGTVSAVLQYALR